MVQSILVSSSGTYSIEISDSGVGTGEYQLGYVINAAVESESNGGSTNNTIGTRQAIDDSLIPLAGTPTQRAAVIGSFTMADTVDYYAINNLNTGLTDTFALRANASGVKLEVYDINGNILASGLPATNVDQIIQELVVTGTTQPYVIAVSQGTAPTGTEYSLLVKKDGAFEVEPNLNFDNAQPVTNTVLGSVTTATFSGTRLNTEFTGHGLEQHAV